VRPSNGRSSVVLADGRPEDLLTAHAHPGLLHIAVSVQLVSSSGSWLLQRRSRSKRAFAGRWANSCCTHPEPAEAALAAAQRRLDEELGLNNVALVGAGSFTYRAADPASGLVEHECDHVFVGFTDVEARANPQEIDELWRGPFVEAMARVSGEQGAPWARRVLELSQARVQAMRP